MNMKFINFPDSKPFYKQLFVKQHMTYPHRYKLIYKKGEKEATYLLPTFFYLQYITRPVFSSPYKFNYFAVSMYLP